VAALAGFSTIVSKIGRPTVTVQHPAARLRHEPLQNGFRAPTRRRPVPTVAAMSRAVPAFLLAGLVALVPAAPVRAAAGWRWPIRGEVITNYRNGSDPYAAGRHRGIDIAAKVGQRVGAATAGTVRFAGVAGSSGLTVSIRTADGRYDTSYLHLSSAAVHKGERVNSGDAVGAVGTSGRRSATAPHVHFGVRRAGSRHGYVDPLELLPPLAAPRAPAPRVVPSPVPVRVRPEPQPVRVRDPGRVPARRPVRVPAGRRVRAPGRAPAPRGLPVPARRGAPARTRVPAHAPQPHAVPDAAPAPAASPAPAPAPHARPAPQADPRPGPDLGWAAACAGLLLAAACIGGKRGGDAEDGSRRRSPLQVPLARLQTALRSLRP